MAGGPAGVVSKKGTRPTPLATFIVGKKGDRIMFNPSGYIYSARCACIAAALLVGAGAAHAANDEAALQGLKDVKVAFDLKEGDGKGLLNRLDVIDETRASLIRQGVSPHFILSFRGPATKLVQTDAADIKAEDRPIAEKIALKIKQMSNSSGVDGMEQCAVAVREQGTKIDKVLPEIRVVGNGFISLMAYQAKGYAYIAP
jgi:intracellular sulfur oxidation DsrE/DsrF family protein